MIIFNPPKEEQLGPDVSYCWKQPDLQHPSAFLSLCRSKGRRSKAGVTVGAKGGLCATELELLTVCSDLHCFPPAFLSQALLFSCIPSLPLHLLLFSSQLPY